MLSVATNNVEDKNVYVEAIVAIDHYTDLQSPYKYVNERVVTCLNNTSMCHCNGIVWNKLSCDYLFVQ